MIDNETVFTKGQQAAIKNVDCTFSLLMSKADFQCINESVWKRLKNSFIWFTLKLFYLFLPSTMSYKVEVVSSPKSDISMFRFLALF